MLQIKDDPISFLENLDFNPITEIIRQRFGCTEQCPFCGISCSNGFECDVETRKHSSELHRPRGLVGMNYEGSNKLVPDICSSSVASEDKRYRGIRDVETWR